MAATFGIFWTTEGLGFIWPFADAILPLIAIWVSIISYACVLWLKNVLKKQPAAKLRTTKTTVSSPGRAVWVFKTIIEFIKEFVIADEWITAAVLWGIVFLGSVVSYGSELWPLVLVYFTVLLPFGLRMNISLKNK